MGHRPALANILLPAIAVRTLAPASVRKNFLLFTTKTDAVNPAPVRNTGDLNAPFGRKIKDEVVAEAISSNVGGQIRPRSAEIWRNSQLGALMSDLLDNSVCRVRVVGSLTCCPLEQPA